MSHPHAHHHHAPPPQFSLLRASAGTRLTIAAGGAVLLWLAVALTVGWI